MPGLSVRLGLLGALLALCSAAFGAELPATAAQASTAAPDERDGLPYFKRSREGWFWYEDPPLPITAAPAAAQAASVAIKPAAKPEAAGSEIALDEQERDLIAFKGFQQRFERALNAATHNPSQANVVAFLELYAQARRKARAFSDQAQTLAVTMPWLDETFTGSRPTSPNAMRVFDSVRQQDRDQLMLELAQSHGLYFFFRQHCAYCHVQATFLKQFEARYGFTVFAVSLDGGVLREFPNAVRDNGLAAQVANALGVPMQHFVTPAIVLARPSTREVVPVGFGVMSLDEMAERVASVVRVREQGPARAVPTQLSALMGSVR